MGVSESALAIPRYGLFSLPHKISNTRNTLVMQLGYGIEYQFAT